MLRRADSLVQGSSEGQKASPKASPKLLGKFLRKGRKTSVCYDAKDLYAVPLKGKDKKRRGSTGFANPNYDDNGVVEPAYDTLPSQVPLVAPRIARESRGIVNPNYNDCEDAPFGAGIRRSRPASYVSIGAGESAYAEVQPGDASPGDYDSFQPAHHSGISPEEWTTEEVKLWLHPIVHEDSRASWEDAVDSGNLNGANLLRLKFAQLRDLENDYYEVFRDIGSVFEAIDLLRGSIARFDPASEPLYDNLCFDDSAATGVSDDVMEWHHGKISRAEAERRIIDQGARPGLFLVRTRHAGTGALTLATEDGVEHYLLYELEGFYTINGRRVNMSRSLVDLIQQLRGDVNNPLPTELRYAVPKPSRDQVPHLPMRKTASASSCAEC